jgi:hypothetical protein
MPKQWCYSIAPSWRQRQGTLSRPLVMGHGGAAFSIPEHTLESYQLAFELGANYVEPDFYPTKEGRLVARHDVDLNMTTNVAHIFPNRSRTLTLNGVSWCTSKKSPMVQKTTCTASSKLVLFISTPTTYYTRHQSLLILRLISHLMKSDNFESASASKVGYDQNATIGSLACQPWKILLISCIDGRSPQSWSSRTAPTI